MNWFGQNRWLGTFLIVLAVLTIGALYFVFSAKSNSDQALARFQEALTEKNRLERLDPFPSEANFRKMKLHLENYTATLNKLKEELKARVPNPPPLLPNEFQSRLRQSMLTIGQKAQANHVKLPDNFALGFEEYTTGLPNTAIAPLLGQELTQVELLLNFLIDARVDGINSFVRRPLADEHGAGAAAAAPTPLPIPAVRAAGNKPALVADSKVIERGVVDVSFSAAPSSARKVVNQIVSAPQQFYILRLLHVRNEKDKGPPREQTAQPATAASGATAASQPAPVKPLPNTALSFIVGNEHIETTARIELLRFTF
ncbi:MAG: Amuc_1100 family pilus-like protein [Chthoniobacterales bacterium]